MGQRNSIEAASLMAASAVLYGLGYAVQDWLFQFTEHMPGVNWFYLPAGLRVVLVLIAGLMGALGIFAATVAINLMYMADLNGPVLLCTALASGFGAWVALWFMRRRERIGVGLERLTAAALVQYALIYSVLNALFHQAVWWAFKRNGSLFMVDVWPMFVGDLLGALFFLYALKWSLGWLRSGVDLKKGDLLS